ncbi:MAG TPA: thioredoxin family protein, partial [Gillisia sp.]|nr:thioredoxin family protein [Gillisia sp.]
KNNISDYEIIVFMGTWCGDSKREVPKLLKILDEAGYDLSNLTMVGVSRNKTTPEKLEEGWDLNRVSSIIFIKDGKEINRFVEYPRETIEDDIAKIVSDQGYKHSYLN